jgi:hypothetical protein
LTKTRSRSKNSRGGGHFRDLESLQTAPRAVVEASAEDDSVSNIRSHRVDRKIKASGLCRTLAYELLKARLIVAEFAFLRFGQPETGDRSYQVGEEGDTRGDIGHLGRGKGQLFFRHVP